MATQIEIKSSSHIQVRRRATRLVPVLRTALAFACLSLAFASAPAETPATGSKAPDFTLSTPTGHPVELAKEVAKGTTVLVVLRGYPGYQCPYCVKQVHDFIGHSSDFAAKKVNVLFVYPGPPAKLDGHANAFLEKQSGLPQNMQLVIDPDYKVTNLYDLRWKAWHETAYPSTFILNKDRTILFAKISHSHGDRTTAADVLSQIPVN